MNIRYFEKNGTTWLDIRGPGFRKRIPSGCKTEAEARLKAPELVAKALEGIVTSNDPAAGKIPQAARSGPTLQEAFKLAMTTREQWIASKDKDTLKQTFKSLGLPDDMPAAELVRDKVRELRAFWLTQPGKRKGTTLSHSAINSRLSMLSVLLEACDLPPHNVKHLSVKGTRRTRRIAQREIAAMQSWLFANSERKGALTLADVMTVALETGGREDELLGLLPGDVNIQDASVTFRDTKNGETRIVPLPPASLKILEARKGNPEGPFSDLGASQLKTLWAAGREALGLKDDHEFVFHILRHEAASRMADAGVNAFVIQAILGHSNITTTQIYVTASQEAMRQGQQAVEQAALLKAAVRGMVQ